MTTYRFDPTAPLDAEVRRVALECLDDALGRLDRIAAGTDDPAATRTAVHEVRKRGKELRALARLARPVLGDGYRPVNDDVRDAGRELSALRDAHVLLTTLDDLVDSTPERADRLGVVRDRQAAIAAAADATLGADDPRLAGARERMIRARAAVEAWTVPDDPDPLREGLEDTYRAGRTALRRLEKKDGDGRSHEWRTSVKRLWYQARLLRDGDPDGIGPLADQLDELSDLLGEDHDMSVLVEHVEAAGDEVDEKVRRATRKVARARQAELRKRAVALGRQVYADRPSVLVARVMDPWEQALVERQAARPHASIERERTFLVAEVPDPPDEGVTIRQGYLALDGRVQVRVRDAGGERTLTVKAGEGIVRTEVEWRIGRDRFDALWPLTAGRRVEKTRVRIPLDGLTAELDVFGGALEGLVLVEVELASAEEAEGFEPPAWFGDEVSDDPRYGNAALAVDGRPD